MTDQRKSERKFHPGPVPITLDLDECIYTFHKALALCVRTDAAHLRVAHLLAREQPAGGALDVEVTDMMVGALRSGQAKVWNERTPISSGALVEVCRVADVGGLEAVAPLMAAQVLRWAAEFVRDDETGAFAHGDHCSYGPPGTCDCERGITYRWLLSRSRGRCGMNNPHATNCVCCLVAGHMPAGEHRYSSVEAGA